MFTTSTASTKTSLTSKVCSPTTPSVPYRSPSYTAPPSESSGSHRRAGASSLTATPRQSATPRNIQTEKSKHKQAHRYRFADEDASAESANMQSGNSRKGRTSITHLMNYATPHRQQQQLLARFAPTRYPRRNPVWGLGSGYHAIDKARYVHANYRFLVDPRGEYHAQSVDADVHLDWKDVLQVLASSQTQTTQCPICLDNPVAPRMAKCGHIFCLPCAIRYMHSDDGEKQAGDRRARWKKCPICHDVVYISELRPVRWYDGPSMAPLAQGDDLVLRLIKRHANSTLAMPRESPNPLAKGEDIPWFSAAEVLDYARIMKGSQDYMAEQLEQDIAAIVSQEREDEVMFGDGPEWTGKAVRTLDEAKAKLADLGNPPVNRLKKETKPEAVHVTKTEKPLEQLPEMNGTSPSTLSEIDKASLLSTRLADFKSQQRAEKQPEYYYFYQAMSSFYLSSLDIRILKDAFKTYDAFPSSLLPRIERVSAGHVVDDDLRKRVKYLAHLPYGSEVGFLECDWTDTVPAEVLEKYKEELDRRRKRNMEKDAREEKERVAAEKAGEREFAASRSERLNIPNDYQQFSLEHFQPLSTGGLSDVVSATTGDASATATSPPFGTHRTHSSVYAPLASPGTSPNTTRTVWGTAAFTGTNLEVDHLALAEPADDGWLQGWEDDVLARDEEMIAQVAATSLDGDYGESSVSGKGKGKKKNKKLTLMSTGVRRGA